MPFARIALVGLVMMATVGPAAAAAPSVENPGFEAGAAGELPAAWALRAFSAAQGFTARAVEREPAGGRRCLEVARKDFLAFGQYAAVSQSVPAAPVRGRRVRFSAMVRTDGLKGYFGAAVYARVHRPGFRPGHAAELLDKPERGTAWVRRAVVVDVAADADQVEVGFVLHMSGTAWFDDAALEDLGPAGAGNDPPAPLAAHGRENVAAFARLLAAVRYFHPSDEAARADWDRFAVEHVAYAEAAKSPAELAARLAELFAPAAPTVRVFVTGERPAAVPELAAPPAGAAARVVGWRHVGADPNGVHPGYESERVADRDLSGGPPLKRSPEPLPDPAAVYEADLGGGVSCRVPVALYADAAGTLPRATAKPRPPTKPKDFPPTGDDRATRLAGVCLAWGLFQHFYPYFEETKADWPAALTEALDAAAADPDAAAFHRTVRRLVARLEDSHGAVRPGSGAPRPDGALPFAWDVVEGKLAVTWVDPDAKLRLKVGDVVEAIDGGPAAERVADALRLASGATPEHRRYRACADLRIGPAGQPVALRIKTPGGEGYDLTVTRKAADDSPLRGPSMREPRLPRLARPAPGVVYLDLDRFTDLGRVPDPDYAAALDEARTADGVVFDVRGYPLVNQRVLCHLAERPLPSDRYSEIITLAPDRRRVVLQPAAIRPLGPLPPRIAAKAAFVTDGRAVSYAETFLALVDNGKLAPVVGEPTAGSNGGVALYVLPDGTRVSWTGQKAVRADGGRLHGVGIRPTVPVSRTLKGLAEGRDEPLERAIELVRPGR